MDDEVEGWAECESVLSDSDLAFWTYMHRQTSPKLKLL